MGFQAVNEVKNARQAKKQRAAFYTPLELVQTMVEQAAVHGDSRCLEPSAGDGRIVHALAEAGVKTIDAVEIEPSLHKIIKKLGGRLIGKDFLDVAVPTQEDDKYDAIVMNPPFKGKEWRKHVEHAWRFLRKGGRLVAVLPDTARDLLVYGKVQMEGCDLCNFEQVNPKAFKDYETSTKTILVIAHRDDDFKHTLVEGFNNHVTYSAAITISSDGDIYQRRANISNEQIRDRYLKSNLEGGHCDYGIDWDEVYGYLRINVWSTDGQVSSKSDGKGVSGDRQHGD